MSESPKGGSAWVSPTPPQWPLTLAGFGLVLAPGKGERAPNLALDGGVFRRALWKRMFLLASQNDSRLRLKSSHLVFFATPFKR